MGWVCVHAGVVPRDMEVGSLFSGIGGLDLGLPRAGLRHAFFCESDPWRRTVLAQHWPRSADLRGRVTFDAERVNQLGRSVFDEAGAGEAAHAAGRRNGKRRGR